jgi:hypothetical protein
LTSRFGDSYCSVAASHDQRWYRRNQAIADQRDRDFVPIRHLHHPAVAACLPAQLRDSFAAQEPIDQLANPLGIRHTDIRGKSEVLVRVVHALDVGLVHLREHQATRAGQQRDHVDQHVDAARIPDLHVELLQALAFGAREQLDELHEHLHVHAAIDGGERRLIERAQQR